MPGTDAAMQGPVAAYLEDGGRLHLQHGPIDLVIGVEGDGPRARRLAFDAAASRFETVLGGLVEELPALRRQLRTNSPGVADPVARRMIRAALPFAGAHFVTPMIAVAGAVADEILDAMRSATPIARAHVNNGGDIAVFLAPGETFSVAVADRVGARLGMLRFDAGSGVGGIATSGTGGRSFSFGIADSVTVVARDAASADTAATLIGNAVDLPGHPGIEREPASDLQPDSDLGARAVVTRVPPLGEAERDRALESGRSRALDMLNSGEILGAGLFLRGASVVAGNYFPDRLGRGEETGVEKTSAPAHRGEG